MGVSQYIFKITVFASLLILPANGLNLGLIAGDNKRLSSPLTIRKVSKLSPVFININSGLPKIGSLSSLPKLPKPLKLPEHKLPKPKRSLPLLLPPLLPRLPLLPILPILPPILPPLLPPLPLFPIIPHLPILPPVPSLPKIKDPLKPLRIPILGKSVLPNIKPVNVNGKILTKLLDLKLKGKLTTPEFLRFKKLLL